MLTNVKEKSACELMFNYKELWRIEDAFGELKWTLRARPVFHWTDERIKGHLVMCFIAYLCEGLFDEGIEEERLCIKEQGCGEREYCLSSFNCGGGYEGVK